MCCIERLAPHPHSRNMFGRDNRFAADVIRNLGRADTSRSFSADVRSERLDFTRPALRSAAEGRRLVRLCAARATLNYFGQGGLLLTDPGAVESPFYQLGKQIVLRDRCDLGRRQARQKPFEAVSSEFVAIGQSTVRGATLRTSASAGQSCASPPVNKMAIRPTGGWSASSVWVTSAIRRPVIYCPNASRAFRLTTKYVRCYSPGGKTNARRARSIDGAQNRDTRMLKIMPNASSSWVLPGRPGVNLIF